ncbi:MAG TPA: hypothetical protein ENN38_04455 [Actinobacteria bacterium]|nr:hypothetical protein [Actinomycetota bacterium]
MIDIKIFGKANEFYRVKLVKLNKNEPEEFDWKEDILYKIPPKKFSVINETEYLVMVVNIDTNEGHNLNRYKSSTQAEKKIKLIEEDLKELTKIQFETKYHVSIEG